MIPVAQDKPATFQVGLDVRAPGRRGGRGHALAADGEAAGDDFGPGVGGLKDHPAADIQLGARMGDEDGVEAGHGAAPARVTVGYICTVFTGLRRI